MEGLSAKVFRTYNASITLQQELSKLDTDLVDIANPEAIKQFYDSANRYAKNLYFYVKKFGF